MVNQYDFIVLGGGSGGIAAARRAARCGAKVVLFEPKRLGGTCVNVGCVPKKVMWNAAQVRHALELGEGYGFGGVEEGDFDWGVLKKGRDGYVGRLNEIYAKNLKESGVEVVRAAGRLGGEGVVEDAEGKVYRAEHILVATGGKPVVPEIAGAGLGITSDGFFELGEQPRRPLLIGAGYIAVELAGLLNALGSRVTMLLRKDRLLRAFDGMLGETLLEQMRGAGVEVRTNVSCKEIVREGDGVFGYRADDNGGAEAGWLEGSGFDCVLFAISRVGNVEGLGLERVGIEAGRGGTIAVDEWQNTAAKGVYAVGDVTGAVQLTPVAIAAGRRLAERLFGGGEEKLSLENVASVVFSHPPIGSVGLSEAVAVERYGAENVRVYQSRFVNMRYALGEEKPMSVMKLVTLLPEERVLGCHVIGEGADEMLQGFAVALNLGARKADFDRTIAIHPTAGEEFVTME